MYAVPDGVGDPDAQRWSPFPVQDWSSMRMEAAGPEPSLAEQLPAWPAPRGERLPLLIMLVVAALLAGTIYVVHNVDIATADRGAARYVPSDGAVWYTRQEATRAATTASDTRVTESARLVGSAGVLSLDWTLSVKVLGALGTSELDSTKLWRTTSTTLGDLNATAQTTAIYRVNGPVELLAESGPTAGYVYKPALLELPADVRPGASWSSSGLAGTQAYRSELRARAGPGGCLVVEGTLSYSSSAGQPGPVHAISKTWCEALGVVVERDVSGDVTTESSQQPAPADGGRVSTAPLVPTWSAPDRWTHKRFTSMSADPRFGSGDMGGGPAPIEPVVTSSGLVIRALVSSHDLVAFTPKTTQAWVSVWRTHPGGSLITLSAFGDVVVATTSNRQAVAYDATGVRLWSVQLDDLATTAPVRVTDDRMALVDISGTVRMLAIGTGVVIWQRSVGADVAAAPVAAGDVLVIMDQRGSTTALEVSSGEQRWQVEVEGKAAAANGDVVVLIADQTAEALSLANGEHRWLRPYDDTFLTMTGFAGRIVVSAKGSTQFIDAGGRTVSTQQTFSKLTVVGGYLIGWGTAEAIVFDTQFRTVVRWPIPVIPLTGAPRAPVAYRHGVLLFDGSWQFEVWSDEP
jgi:outer membrane protein assembly factor BamB